MSKQMLGQFYTTSDVFNTSDAFACWFEKVPKGVPILEPFAGAGHLFSHVEADWHGFDLDPKHSDVSQRDTLLSFPRGYSVCITNPPYLAKTVISRKKLPVKVKREDLYLDCLKRCLHYCDYVAAIIPSTFWNQKLFKDRLFAWDKLDKSVFSDTDNPVGVAYFIPERVISPRTFVNGVEIYLGEEDAPASVKFPVKFNVPSATEFLMVGIDEVAGDNIHLRTQVGKDMASLRNEEGEIKSTNRNLFTVECPFLREDDLQEINKMLTEWRKRTSDFYLTSFKSCGKSGKYRKRMSFKEVKWLLSKYYEKVRLSELPAS